MSIIVPGPIGKNGGIEQFSAAGTLPGIERADKVIKPLGKHAAFATRTMHSIPPDIVINPNIRMKYILCANCSDYMPVIEINKIN